MMNTRAIWAMRAAGGIALLVAPAWGQEAPRVSSAQAAASAPPAMVAMHKTVGEKTADQKTVKVLAIGNSFSEDSTAYLHDLVDAAGGRLVLAQAYIPGCPLDVHVAHAKAYEADPKSKEGSPYDLRFAKDVGGKPGEKASLKDLLTMADWEYVTIQQASIKSFKPETFEPDGRELAAYIHKYAPKAKIVVHETWAYRSDDPLFKDGTLTHQEMYERLHANYAQLAKDVGAVGIIPVGTAYETVLKDPRWVFKPAENVDVKTYAEKALPQQENSLNVGWKWASAPTATRPAKLDYDGHHSSQMGRYLGACCWFEFFYGDVRGLAVVPKGGTDDKARVLQEVAHMTVKEKAPAK